MDRISALMDGELDEHGAQQEFAHLRQDGALRETWDTFHLISDALHGNGLLSARFSQTLSERLQQEPVVLAPHRSMRKRAVTYMLSAAASLSAVALVAWVAVSTHAVDTAPVVAEVPLPMIVATPAPAAAAPAPQLVDVPYEGKMNEYMLAHQEFSPSTAIQGVAPYIRSVSTR